jgi:integrase
MCELKFLTFKTALLVALASGKRRSELAALRRDGDFFRPSRDWQIIRLFPDPSFIAKTQRPHSLAEPVLIKALQGFVAAQHSDIFLCPVRALSVYLDRTKPLQGARKKLFLPLSGKKDQEISPDGIARLIKSAVIEAYNHTDGAGETLFKVNSHQLRLFSSSLAHASKVSCEDIMTACSWSSESTFTNFYLRSLASHSDSLFSLGPLSVAQTVVQPGARELSL